VTGPLALALVVASRFGVVAGLALWIAAGVAALVAVPLLFRKLERARAEEVAAALLLRLDFVVLGAALVLLVSLGARIALDGAAPPRTLLLPIAGALLSRLVAALAVGPAYRALRIRLANANAPASDAERAAFGRLHGASLLLHTLELCLIFYALYAVS
jgi:hypothetical protein